MYIHIMINNNELIILISLLLIRFLIESKNYIDKSSKDVQSDQNNATILTTIRDHMLNEGTCSNLRKYEAAPMSSQNLLQHHEDSGIEISMKKDDNLEGEDFLERARKVSLIEFASAIMFTERSRLITKRLTMLASRFRLTTIDPNDHVDIHCVDYVNIDYVDFDRVNINYIDTDYGLD